MNKSEQAQVKTKDAFVVYKDVVDKTFESISQSVPQYHQSIANAQQEAFKAIENNVAYVIETQKELVAKTGIPTTMSEAGIQAVKDAADGYLKLVGIGNQVVLTAIDATQQNIKNAGENIKAYNDLSQTAVRSWITAFGTYNRI